MTVRLTLDTNLLQEYWREQEKRDVVVRLLRLADEGKAELVVTNRISDDIPGGPQRQDCTAIGGRQHNPEVRYSVRATSSKVRTRRRPEWGPRLSAVIAARGRWLAAVRLCAAELVAFSALGWLVAGILDVAGAFRLSDALVVSGLVMGVVTGIVAFQGSDRPLIRARPLAAMGMAGLTYRVGPGVPPSGARALAIVSAVVAAVGLIAAGAASG